jgi:uncharacterized protein YpmS
MGILSLPLVGSVACFTLLSFLEIGDLRMVTKCTMWRSSHGNLFDTKEEAIQAECFTTIKDILYQVIEGYDYSIIMSELSARREELAKVLLDWNGV